MSHKNIKIQTNMKKLLLLTASAGLFFASCQKDDQSNPGTAATAGLKPSPTSTVPVLPSSFVKKVLVEEFIGTSYPLVPEACRDLSILVQTGKDRVYSAGLHVGDVMTTNQTNFVLAAMGNTNPIIPCGLVNRHSLNNNLFLDSKDFAAAITNQLSQVVSCGLSISTTMNSKTAAVTVNVGFTGNMPGTYKVITYLTEDKVINYSPSYYQMNGFNNNPSSPYFNAGNPIHGFQYYNAIRRTLSRMNGDAVSQNLQTAGNIATFNYQIDMLQKLAPGSGVYMIESFIVDATTNDIINVQQCILGANKGWN